MDEVNSVSANICVVVLWRLRAALVCGLRVELNSL